MHYFVEGPAQTIAGIAISLLTAFLACFGMYLRRASKDVRLGLAYALGIGCFFGLGALIYSLRGGILLSAWGTVGLAFAYTTACFAIGVPIHPALCEPKNR